MSDPRRNIPPGSTIAVWFSCGAASAVAAKMTIEKYGNDCKIRIINNPIAEEHPDNKRFLKDIQKWIDVDIEESKNPKYPKASCVEIWDRGYMSGPYGSPCTKELKKNARQHWEKVNHHDYLVLGFTADEKKRAERFALTERDTLIPILVDYGITKQMCFNIIQNEGIQLPYIYTLGFPNANCIGCVKAASPTYWNLVREKFPQVFKHRAEQSRKIGCRLVKVKGERVFLDELDPNEKGRDLKDYGVECGIFCEEPDPEEECEV